MLNGDSLNVSFRRHLTGNNLRDWMVLGHRVANIQLGDIKDIGVWQLQKKRPIFSSLYVLSSFRCSSSTHK